MPSVINTNIASLNAQRNLSMSQSTLQTSLQRLSSGLRINSAKDDAAGLAITSRMTSQINGLNQAVRNANDGVSLAQSAEGALGTVGDNLQRIRELAIQSANSTNSSSDRAAINSEAQQLLSEIQRVAQTTQFNGLNLLDGSFSAAQFQVGANANQTIALSITAATTSALGSWGGTGASVNSTKNGSAAPAWSAISTVQINGFSVGASVANAGTPGWTAGSAAAKALAINSQTSNTGVSATASTTMTGAAPLGNESISNVDLTINGIAVGPIASATTAVAQGQNAAAAINLIQNQTGVVASYSTTSGALTLAAADGRDINIGAGNAASAAILTRIYDATGLTATSQGTTTAPTLPTAGTSTVAFGAKAVAADTVTINGVVFTFADAGALGANAYTVNSATSVTVSYDVTNGTAALSGAALVGAFNAAKADSRTSTALAPISAAGGATVTLSDSRLGLAATVGRTVAASAATATQQATGADMVAGTNAAFNIYGGTLTLSSANQFTLTGTNTGLTDGGFAAFTSGLSQLSGVALDTVGNANSAISVVDAALSQINTQRAALGAYQNRFSSLVTNLQTSSENLSSARSRIQDTDFAAETANLTRAQILQQAGTAMLAQANALPNQVLTLLK
jgi:flagellin